MLLDLLPYSARLLAAELSADAAALAVAQVVAVALVGLLATYLPPFSRWLED